MDSVQSAISGILKAEGRIDLLVCNAGVSLPKAASTMDQDEDAYGGLIGS